MVKIAVVIFVSDAGAETLSAFLSKITAPLSRLTSNTMSALVSKELLNAALLSTAQNGKNTKTVKTRVRNMEINLFNAKSPLKRI